jgi:hypothetical protein
VPCPFVQAVDRGDLDEAHRLAVLDGETCEPVVFDLLVGWARGWADGLDIVLVGGVRLRKTELQRRVQAFHGDITLT